MKILVNGCSYTKGSCHTSNVHPQETYSHILAGRLAGVGQKYTLQDISLNGSCNSRIVRDITNQILKQTKPFNVIVIQWTEWSRFDYPDKQGIRKKFNPVFFKHFFEEYKLATKDSDFILKLYRGTEEQITALQKDALIQFIVLDRFIKSISKDTIVVHVPWFPLKKEVFDGRKGIISKMNFLVDPTIGMEKILFSHGFRHTGLPIKWSHPSVKEVDKHFGTDAHLFIAKALFRHINSGRTLQLGKDQYEPKEESLNVYEEDWH